MKKILCCGGRKYADAIRVNEVLSACLDKHGKFFLIEGGATGADRLCREWARKRGLPVATVNADWDLYKLAAGPVRNGWLLELQPDGVIAFPGNVGTADMMQKAKAAGINVWEVV